MLQLLGSAVSLIVAIPLWIFVLTVVPHTGTKDLIGQAAFFSPILLFGLPASFVGFARGGPALGLFLAAICPLLAPLNIFLLFSTSNLLARNELLALLILSLGWVGLTGALFQANANHPET